MGFEPWSTLGISIARVLIVLLLIYGKLPYIINIDRILQFDNMATSDRQKSTARLEARIGIETKALLQKAAELEGRTLTDFVVAAVLAEARRVIKQHQTLKLGIEDSEAFVDALLNPPKPNDALKAAALQYKEMMSV